MLLKKTLKIGLGIFLLFATILIIWQGVSSKNIITNQSIFSYHWVDIIAGIATVYFIVELIKEIIKRNSARGLSNIIEFIKLLILIPASIFIIPFFIKLFFEQSLMLLLHQISANESTKIVKVQEKIHTRRCQNGVLLKDYSFMNGRICDIPDELLNNLKYNDTLIIKGKESYFGFTTEVIFRPSESFD